MVCLVSAPTVTEFEGLVKSRAEARRLSADHPPLGILSLSAVLRERGIAHQLFDLNRLFCSWVCGECDGRDGVFFPQAVRELTARRADVYGFGTISSSYPLTIRLAREVKRTHPDAVILFGGPQASAVDIETLEAFPFVDAIVRGEAEETLPELLSALSRGDGLDGLPGITFRRNGSVIRAPDAPLLAALDGLPLPAFDLWPEMKTLRTVPLEIGRGCPFGCTFCSTSHFFRRRFRLKTPARVIAQMQAVQQAYGITKFDLMHDMFTVDRALVVEFCQALLRSGCEFDWTCSARTDCVDEELLALMAKAGCSGIFFGVETGSASVQRAIGKNLDINDALTMVHRAVNHDVAPTVSLITGFPGETRDDLRHSVEFIMDSLLVDHVQAQFHLLAPLAGTAIDHAYRERLTWDGIFSDMAFQGWRQDAEDCALIREYPRIFPNFYAVPTPLDRHYLIELRDFVTYATGRFRWLLVALHRYAGILTVFDQWRAWRAAQRPPMPMDGEYYASAAFRSDFLSFVRSVYGAAEDPEAIAIATLLEYETLMQRMLPRGAADLLPVANPEAVPRVAPGITILHLGADYERIIECLRSKRSLVDIPRRPVVVADRLMPSGEVQVLQLSPLSAALIEVCDGVRTLREISSLFPRLDASLERFPPEAACRLALNELVRQGILVFSPGAAKAAC